jgi:hypothetical protein
MEKTVYTAMQWQNFLQWIAVTFAHQSNPNIQNEVQDRERIFLKISPAGMMTAKMDLEGLVIYSGSRGKEQVVIEVATGHPLQITEQEIGMHTILAAAAIRKTMGLSITVFCLQQELVGR